jgi:uncharacterized protein (TIGR03000 family)
MANGALLVVVGLTAAAPAAPVGRPAPTGAAHNPGASADRARPGFIDTSWQNDPLTWYRIQHRGEFPPPWWWRDRYPFRPYPYPVYPPAVVVPQVVPVPVPQGVPTGDPAQDARPARGMIQVLLPDAKAEVALDGKLIPGLGMKRWLNTPSPVTGQEDRCEVTASWWKDGRSVTETRTVQVAAGKYGFVDFTRPAATTN